MVACVKYPATEQLRNAIQNVRHQAKYQGKDESGQPIYANVAAPVLTYLGTVKIHGSHADLVKHPDGSIVCQSRANVLSLEKDNAGFWEAMQYVDMEDLFSQVEKRFYELNGWRPEGVEIVIAGEWAGGNIQSGVAINGLPKFFTIFNIKVDGVWQGIQDYDMVRDNELNIYNILQFPRWELDIDFEHPELVQNYLIEITEEVEQQCPVGAFFGKQGVGEGVVWTPIDPVYAASSRNWFKVKGSKHSSSKVKTLAAVDVEKVNSIAEFVEYAATESRLMQGITEVGLDIARVGEYIRWVNADVFKEEADTLKAAGLEMKDVGKAISNVARKFYMQKL